MSGIKRNNDWKIMTKDGDEVSGIRRTGSRGKNEEGRRLECNVSTAGREMEGCESFKE